MGGPIAQLMWRRHPPARPRAGARARRRRTSAPRARSASASSASPGSPRVARLTPRQARLWLTEQFYLKRKAQHVGAVGHRAGRPSTTGGWCSRPGGRSARYDARPWIGEVDVPTRAVITMRDHVVPLRRQIRAVPGDPRLPRRSGSTAITTRSSPTPSSRRCWSAPASRVAERAADARELAPPTHGARRARRARCAAHSARSSLARHRNGSSRRAGATRRRADARGGHATSTSPASAHQVGGDVRVDRGAQAVRVAPSGASSSTTSASCAPPRPIAERLGNMKGALMKLGQMASYLDEGLPAPMRDALAELQANAPAMSGRARRRA